MSSYSSTTAQADIVARTGYWQVRDEAVAYGTEGATAKDALFVDEPNPALKRMTAADMRQSGYMFDHFRAKQTLKRWELSVKFHPGPNTTQYVAAASPADTFQDIIMRCALGGQQRAAGDTVAASPSPTTTTFSVTTGSNFPAGSLILVEVAGTLYPCMVTDQSTNALTVVPALPSAPGTGAIVVNGTTSYLAQTNSHSLSLRGRHGSNANWQHQLLGGMVTSLAFASSGEGLLEATVQMQGTSWSGPDALSYAHTVTNDCVGPIAARSSQFFMFPSASPNRTHMPFEALDLKIDLGNEFIPDKSGGSIEGVIGVRKVGKRDAVSGTLKVRADSWHYYSWEHLTDLALMRVHWEGTGLTARAVITCIPGLAIEEVPAPVNENGVFVINVPFMGLQNKLISSPSTDLAKSPYLISMV